MKLIFNPSIYNSMSFVIIQKGEIVGPKTHHSTFDHIVIVLMILCLISFRYFNQDFSRCFASTKNLKSSFEVSTCWFKSLRFKIASSTQDECSSLDQDLYQVKKEKKIFKEKISKKTCVMFVSVKILFLDKM